MTLLYKQEKKQRAPSQNILVVDDEKRIRETLVRILSETPHHVDTATDGKNALEKWSTCPYDLMIIDLKMPVMDGETLVREIRKKDKYLAIIILTGHGSLQQAYTLLQSYSISDFIQKSQDIPEQLLFSVENALEKQWLAKQHQKYSEELIRFSSELQQQISATEQAYNLLKSIFEGMEEGVITLDSHFQVQMISTKACKILDIPEEKALYKPASSILGTFIAGPSGIIMECIKEKKGISNVQTRLLTPGGAIIPVILTITPLEQSLSDVQWLLFFRDRREEERMMREKSRGITFGQMISSDPKMQEIFQLIDNVSSSNATILIQGESGTGKELIAKEIHERSQRAQTPFYAINCAAVPHDLLESEFFGHERGAFTGAMQTKPGHFELAHNGSLFLDEIGEIPLDLQVKLLRAIQEQTFKRVGGQKFIQVDVRIIAATNRDLWKMVQEQQFREDLYYRLDVISIKLPPLRERLQDIPLLVMSFIEELNKKDNRSVQSITPEVHQQFLNYSWPGNIRELYNAVEYGFAVSHGDIIQKQHLPEKLKNLTTSASPVPPKTEKEAILHALEQTNFRKGKAAALLGISSMTLYRKMKKYNI